MCCGIAFHSLCVHRFMQTSKHWRDKKSSVKGLIFFFCLLLQEKKHSVQEKKKFASSFSF